MHLEKGKQNLLILRNIMISQLFPLKKKKPYTFTIQDSTFSALRLQKLPITFHKSVLLLHPIYQQNALLLQLFHFPLFFPATLPISSIFLNVTFSPFIWWDKFKWRRFLARLQHCAVWKAQCRIINFQLYCHYISIFSFLFYFTHSFFLFWQFSFLQYCTYF